MDISIYGRNLEVTSRLESYVKRKMERLDRYMPGVTQIRVDLAEETSHRLGQTQTAQITLHTGRGTILRAEERTGDIFAAIDAVIDKLYRQIERYKGKNKRRGGQEVDFGEYETAIQVDEDEIELGTVLRRKQFSRDPMQEAEAMDQMELLGHDFYVFVNADTGQVNVLYRRHDGNYGLLEPEAK